MKLKNVFLIKETKVTLDDTELQTFSDLLNLQSSNWDPWENDQQGHSSFLEVLHIKFLNGATENGYYKADLSPEEINKILNWIESTISSHPNYKPYLENLLRIFKRAKAGNPREDD